MNSLFYRGGTFMRRLGRRVNQWASVGIRGFGAVAMLWTGTVRANPVGEQVVGGAAHFERVGNSLTIQQGTDRAVINWNNFSIGAGETTKFVMPSASSAALNRVLSGNPSAIYGSLQANGHLFLINPAGIMVGPGGTINAASFLASTHDIDPESFMKGGDLNLLGNSSASILNQGKIEASSGDVFLIAQHIENEGQIMAKDGTVGMVSGTQVSLQAVGPHGFKVRLLDLPDEKAKSKNRDGVANVVNEGVIEAANAMLEATGNVGSLAINNRGTIKATGVRPNADGSVSLIGGEGDVVNSGVIAALRKNIDGQTTGGEIQIAGKNVTTEESSLITAAGSTGGGQVTMQAAETTLVAGRIEATGYGRDSKGGQVKLLGKNVGIRAGEVNADGGAKGGTVLAGGDYLGLNPEIPNAKATVITPEAKISANATVNGDGGKVVVWSDDYTGFFGSITALGGPEGGNGGFIETSSKNNLQAFGEAQAFAPKGMSGEWLLDPSYVIVSDRNTSGGWFSPGNPTIFTPFYVDTAYILNTQINSALNLGTSVTITTGSSTTLDCGEIIINAPIAKTFGGNATLTLDSDTGITINADITSVSGGLFMDFRADNNADGFGSFTLANSANLFSNGGNITVTAADVVLNGTMNTLQVAQAAVTVNSGGSYTVGTVPTVAIAPPAATGGVEASAIALMGIQGASVILGGSGYTGVPTVRIVGGGGQNAVITPSMGVPTGLSTVTGAVTIAIAGSGYTVGDTVTVSGGGGTGATGTVTSVNGSGGITEVTIDASGSGYTYLPSANVTGTGTGACIEINQLFVQSVNVTNPGTGYTSGMTLQINGGGGSGATAQVDSVQVVNLSFDGTSANPDVGAPSYGVGYAAGQTLTTVGGEILFAGSGLGGADVDIGPLVSVAGNIVLKPSAAGTTIGVGTGTGTFGVSDAEIGRLNAASSILPGTVTVGNRAAGALSVGGLNPGGQNLTLSTGGSITGVSAEGVGNNITMTGGLLTLDAAGTIGTGISAGSGLQVSAPRLAVITEGDFFNLYNTTTLTQFHLTTDGTVATQRMVDNQPGTSNLNWLVTEAGENTFINGITVLSDSVDIRYENSLGNINVFGGGVSSVMINAVNTGATGITFGAPAIAGGVQATATIAGGTVTITNPGSGYTVAPTITLVGGTSTQNFAGLGTMNCQPANSSVAQVNFRDFALSAPSGNIVTFSAFSRVPLFTGGGNLTLTAQDIDLPGFTRGSLTLTDITTSALASVAYANLGVLNTFQAVPQIDFMPTVYTAANAAAPALTYTGSSFGSRVALAPSIAASAGSISGQGGVLTIEATSPSAEGRQVSFSPAGGEVGMNIDVRETALLEAPGIRIGGPRTDDITLTTMITPLVFSQGSTTRNATGVDDATYNYDPRYFENPFFNATRFSSSPQNVNDDTGVPHVTRGTVSLVSALGAVQNVSGGDVNVSALSLTGFDGFYFDGQSDFGTYAALGQVSASGSIVPAISGRVGRTYGNTQIGNGGDATYKFNYSTGFVNDSRLPAAPFTTFFTGSTSISQLQSNPQEAKATATITGGKVASLAPDVNGQGYLYTAEPLVTITGGGVQQASARAILSGTGVARVAPQILGEGYAPSVLDPATGLTTGPDVSIIGNGSGALVGNGGRAFVSDSGMISPFSVLNGGSGYDPAAPPQVIISGGGSGVTRPAVVRTEVNSAGQVSAIIVVDPGVGYDNSPVSVLIQAPASGGVRAEGALDNDFRPVTFGNSLNPVYVAAAGTGYTVEPAVAITGGGIRQAQAKAVVQLDRSSEDYGRVLGYVITDAGLGYTAAPTVTVGSGQAFGNFGEYGVSTETVDRNVGSGNITLTGVGAPVVGGLALSAPVRTGDALGVSGDNAITGSILLDIPGALLANPNNGGFLPNPGGARGIVITGDASIIPGAAGLGNTRSGSVTIQAIDIANDISSSLAVLTGSTGLPIQIGTATGGLFNITGNLNAALLDRVVEAVGVGDMQIYAPAPGQVQVALGNVPLDSNHREVGPRTSNDLYLSGLSTPVTQTDLASHTSTDESLVTVEVGAFEGKLTLLRRAESQANATVVNGRVTLITPDQGGQLFATAPTVVITGGGVTPAEASVFVRDGTLVAPNGGTQLTLGNGLDVAGQGYYVTPDVTFRGGGGSGAQAVAVINSATGAISSIQITNPGYGYTSLPQVLIGAPAGIQAQATAAIPAGTTVPVQAVITVAGAGYPVAPLVTVSGGLYGTATATATVNANTQIEKITINVGTDVFPSGVATLTIAPPSGAAQATAVLQDGLVTGFSINSPGGGYSSVPSVLLTTGTTTPYALALDRVGFIADRLQIFDAATPSNTLIEAGLAAIAPWTNQRPVNLGQEQAGASSYVASDLARFLVNDLVVGRRNSSHLGVGAGEFTVSSALVANNLRIANGIFLAGTRGLSDLGGTTGISFDAVSINVGSTVNLTGSGNQIHYVAGIIQGPFDELTYAKPFTLSSGLRQLGSSVQPLTIAEIFGNPAYFTGERFNQGITTQNGDVNLIADLLEQTRLMGFIDTTGEGKYPVGSLSPETFAGSSTVTLAPLTSARPISIYYNSPGSGLALRIGNPAAPGLEQIRAGAVKIGSATSGSITLNSDFGFNYLTYPEAPRALILQTAGSITLGVSQIPPSPIPVPQTSSILVPNLSLSAGATLSIGAAAGALAPILKVSSFAANLTSPGQSLSFTTTQPELTIADFSSLGGATGIATAAGSNVTINVPGNLYVPLMPPQLQASPANTSVLPSTITSGGNITLNSTVAGGLISIAVVNNFDTAGWNSPVPTGSTVNSTVAANSANAIVTMTADRIEIGDNGSNVASPGLLYPPLIASNLTSGRVILQPTTAGTAIVLGGSKGGGFSFTGTELGNIQGNILQVGNSSAGNISVETLIQLDTNRLPGAFSLIGNGTITDLGIASLAGIQYGSGLRLSGNGAISFESLLNQFGTVAANSNGHDITLTSTGFFIGPVDNLPGITATGSRVTLQPSSAVPINLGTKTLTSPGVLYGGTGYTTAPTVNFSGGGAGSGASATASVAAGAVTGVALTSPGSGYTANPLITLSGGSGSNASAYATSDFSFTDAMLDLVTASTLQIGRNDVGLESGTITVSAAISPANINTLSLWTGAGVSDNGNPTGIQVGSLAIRAGTGNVVLNGSGNNVSNLAAVVSSGGFAFTDNPSTAIPLPLNISSANGAASVDGLFGIDTAAGNGAITLTADDMNIVDPISAGSGVITLQPLTFSSSQSINLNDNTPNPNGGILSLNQAELQLLNTSSTVVIGNASGAGPINLGGLGSIDLSGSPSYAYSLTLRGAASPLIFNGGLTLANNNRTLTLNLGTGAVTSPFTGTDLTIGGAGTLSILSAGSVGVAGVPLTTALGTPLPAPGVSGILSGAVITPGGLFLSNSGALNITGPLNVTGDIDITTQSGNLTASQAINSANLSLTSGGSLSVSQAVNANGNATLTASGGALTLGLLSTVNATGNITGSANGNITIQNAVTSGGIVSFSSTAAGTGITVGVAGSITSTLANSVTGTPTIQLTADDLVLNGTLQAANSSGGILLQPFSVAKPIEVFGVAATLPGAYFIGDAVFKDQLLGTAPVTIGRSNGTGEVLVNSSANAYKTGRNQFDRNLAIQSGNLASGQSFNVVGSIKSSGNDIIFKAGQGDFTASAFIDASINNDGSENLTSGSISVFAGTINLTQTPTLRANGAINFGFIGGDTYVNVPGLHPGALSINFVPNSIQTRGYLTFGSPAGGSSVFLGSIDLSTVGGLGLFAGETGQIQLQNNLSGGNIYIDGPLVVSQPLQTTINSSGSVFVINGIQSASTQTLRVLSVGDFTFASNVNPANLAGTLNLDGVSGSILLGMSSASVPQALQGVYVGSSVSLPTRGLDQRFASTFTLPKAAALQGGAISMTGVGGANLNLAAGALSGSQNLSLTTTGGGSITTASLQTSSLTLNSSTSANIGGAIVTTGATSLTAGTTLATQAITASALNVAAGTSATLSGAVNTSASGGTTVSTPTLTTGSTMTAALGDINLAVNSMNLANTATAETGNVTLTPFTAGSNLNLGSQLPASSILQLQAPNGSVTFQTTGAGQILLSGPINLSSSGTDDYNLVTAGGNVVFSGSSPVLTLPSNGLLTLNLGNGNVISSGGTDYAASQGQLVILSAGNVTLGTDIPTFGRPGVVTAPASLTLRNAGSLSLVGPIDTGTGNVSIRTLSGNLTLASTVAGGTIQLGAAGNFNNLAGPTPFTNRGGRTLIYSYGQGYDNPYNFAGLQGFGVAFGRGFGSTVGSGNMLIYSSYAQVALDYGVVYNEMFAGNSVSSLLALDSSLFRSINGLGTPKAQAGGYIDYMLYPQRVEPATSTLPNPVLSRLEQRLGRPPTISEIVAEEASQRQGRMLRTGALLERNSFDEPLEEEVQSISRERIEREDGLVPDGGVPQAQAPSIHKIPTASNRSEQLGIPQASKVPVQNQGGVAPMLRRAPNRAVATLRSEEPDLNQILQQERERAAVGTAIPVANQK